MRAILKLTALSAVLLMLARIIVSCNEKESTELVGEWTASPISGYTVTLTINNNNEVYVNMLGTPPRWGEALSDELQYIIEENKMFPIHPSDPNRRVEHFLITMLSSDRMRLEYFGINPSVEGFIKNYEFNRKK